MSSKKNVTYAILKEIQKLSKFFLEEYWDKHKDTVYIYISLGFQYFSLPFKLYRFSYHSYGLCFVDKGSNFNFAF